MHCAALVLSIGLDLCLGGNTCCTSSSLYEVPGATACGCDVLHKLLLMLFKRWWSNNGSGKEHGEMSESFSFPSSSVSTTGPFWHSSSLALPCRIASADPRTVDGVC